MKYKIGEFSKLTMLTIKTLRYYHEIGILLPSEIDEENGYRYYNENGFERAKLIKLLKGFDFSIKEIEEVLVNYEDESDITAYLLEKNELIQKKVNEYKKIQKKISEYKHYKEVSSMNSNEIKQCMVEDALVISVTFNGKYSECGKYIGMLFKAAGASAIGKPFCIYHDEEYKEDNAQIEVCLEVKKELNKKDIVCKTLIGGSAIRLIHQGPYDTLSNSYKLLADYIQSNDLNVSQPVREKYLKGPGMLLKGNPEKYQTELTFIL